MVLVTERAVEELKKTLKAENKEEFGIKLYISSAGCHGPSYGMAVAEKAEDGEKVITSNGIKLFLTEQIETYLDGFELDFVETEYGAGFTVYNPNETASSCDSGCSSCH
ncbi:MAG TPA: iron-sulfur cluster assembly accessory protein [Euryarchaeota archaeon]|nr:iron-sulfur cluster insertion protein ErpA [archaeon BMS3Bbin15]HDL15718.1 iron-sulfur cluster assembly accessory protein [Euryarchaeota archaeon]